MSEAAKSLFDDDDDDLDSVMASLPEEDAAAAASSSSLAAAMTTSQKARAERNRLKALSLKQARVVPYDNKKTSSTDSLTGEKVVLFKEKKLVDSGAGFFIEEADPDSEASANSKPLVELPPPIVEPDRPKCVDCGESIADSFLLRSFEVCVCDKCKDADREAAAAEGEEGEGGGGGKYELITKTDAKNTFLLKDHHLEGLAFILRKNPHNSRWGDMKLYLRSKVEAVAMSAWGSEEALEREHRLRDDKRDRAKAKKFDKQIKALRMQVRGSLYQKDLSAHEHEYGEEESYDEDADEYSRTCKTCGYVHKYEKL